MEAKLNDNNLNIFNPPVESKRISNEDYLFCLDRTVVKRHLEK